MQAPSRTWPDGRPVGGVNGYPKEYEAWNLECQARHVAKRMAAIDSPTERREELEFWQGKMPGLSADRVKEIVRNGGPDHG